MNIILRTDYNDPEKGFCEIVERKGIGHPDTLADKLAELCSIEYSRYCLKRFGCILHHNFDKLYIGAGCFVVEDGNITRKSPIKIILNGRVSNTMNGESIDVKCLLEPIIKEYISSVIPRIDVENDLDIQINATQHSKRPYWFTPRDIDDIPDANQLFSGDTSLCVSHTGYTLCEKLCLKIEGLFFNLNSKGYPTPKFHDVGQDIKVLISRVGNEVDITVCLPILYEYSGESVYEKTLRKYEELITNEIKKIDNKHKYTYSLHINKQEDGTYRKYVLLKGSCIECGEEGVVGRGNKSSNLISAFRGNTMEAPYGKNERYHTGRVLDFLCRELGIRIFNETNVKNSIFCIARNKNSLLNPYFLYVQTESYVSKETVEKLINIVFNEETYLYKILNQQFFIDV